MSAGFPGTQRGCSQTGTSRSASALLGIGHRLGERFGLTERSSERTPRRGLAYRVPERELPLTHPAEAGAEQLPVCSEDGPQRAGALVRPGSLLLARLVG